MATGTTLATIPTGEGLHEIAVSHDGRWAVVSVYGTRNVTGNSLVVIDLQTATATRTIDLREKRRPHGMAFLPGNRKLPVTCESAQQVLVVDLASGAMDTSIATGQASTHMVAMAHDGTRAYTTDVSAGSVSAIDLTARTAGMPFVLGTRVEDIALTPDETDVPPMADSAGAAARGASPQGVTISGDARTACATLKTAGEVAIADIAERRIVRRLRVGGGSDGVGYSPVQPGR